VDVYNGCPGPDLPLGYASIPVGGCIDAVPQGSGGPVVHGNFSPQATCGSLLGVEPIGSAVMNTLRTVCCLPAGGS
jgi:hypothetical protein